MSQLILDPHVMELWTKMKHSVLRLQDMIEEAHDLLEELGASEGCDFAELPEIAESSTTVHSLFSSIPSSEPMFTQFMDLDSDLVLHLPQEVDRDGWDRITLRRFRIDTASNDIDEIWNLWHTGTSYMPSVQFMVDKYGMSNLKVSREDRQRLNSWRCIVREITAHLDNGRDLHETLVVARLHLSQAGGDVHRLARVILDNSDHGRLTLFEDQGLSTDRSQEV